MMLLCRPLKRLIQATTRPTPHVSTQLAQDKHVESSKVEVRSCRPLDFGDALYFLSRNDFQLLTFYLNVFRKMLTCTRKFSQAMSILDSLKMVGRLRLFPCGSVRVVICNPLF